MSGARLQDQSNLIATLCKTAGRPERDPTVRAILFGAQKLGAEGAFADSISSASF